LKSKSEYVDRRTRMREKRGMVHRERSNLGDNYNVDNSVDGTGIVKNVDTGEEAFSQRANIRW
jgi:hypothetical protein